LTPEEFKERGVPYTVECALMALEKWLYDEIEKRNSITQWVDYIYAHGESVALRIFEIYRRTVIRSMDFPSVGCWNLSAT
jgi:hypothetical protein